MSANHNYQNKNWKVRNVQTPWWTLSIVFFTFYIFYILKIQQFLLILDWNFNFNF